MYTRVVCTVDQLALNMKQLTLNLKQLMLGMIQLLIGMMQLDHVFQTRLSNRVIYWLTVGRRPERRFLRGVAGHCGS